MAVMTQEEFQQKYKRPPAVTPMINQQQQPPPQKSGLLDTVFGGNQIGESLVKAGANIGNLATGGVKKYNEHLAENTVDVPALAGDYIKAASNFIPGAGKAAGFLGKTAVGAATGYAMDVGSKLKNKENETFTPGLGTAVGGLLPGAGAVIRPASAIVGRLFKGLGSGLSGVSSETIDRIIANPKDAITATKRLKASGNNRLLEENARTILNGVSQIRKEASSAYGKGLDALSEVDINPEHLKKGFFDTLSKHGVEVTPDGKMDFTNAEFLDPKIQARAEKVINFINQRSDTTGSGVRKTMDSVESAKFKSAPDGDRQAFNAFIGDLKNSLKEGVNQSTDKLGEINAKYSADQQLAEATEDIFGNVNFKNLPEVVKASQKLEGLFNQKGLAPEVVDNFLKRIGVDPDTFKTTEAVRQIDQKSSPSNTAGLNFGEVTRAVTSAVITPEMVKNLSVATGMAKETIVPFLSGLKTPARNAVIQALLQGNTDN